MFQAYELDRSPRRAGELAMWAVLSAAALSGAGALALRFAHSETVVAREKSVEVAFRPPPPPPEPAKIENPPPPPPPPKKVVVPKPVAVETPVAAPVVAAAAAAPMVAPKEVPKEQAPSSAQEVVPAAQLAVGGTGDGSGNAVGASHNDAEESPEPARAKSGHAGPVNLPEDAEPPEASEDNVLPEYPEGMRESGQEATVILKIVIEADGRVSNVLVMKGDEPFVSAAINAVKTWHYEPATLEGTAISVFRIVKIPFRLKS